MLEKIKAIIFDLDDTLYPQKSYKVSGFMAVADWLQKNKGIDYDVTLEYLNEILEKFGPSYPYMFNQLAVKLTLSNSQIKDLISIFINHDPAINCFPGVPALLSQLKNNYSLGLLTDGRMATQQKKVRSLNLETFFNSILYSDSLSLEKPAPELYAFFEDTFRLRPSDLCYVGDNPNKDFIEAKRRGWSTVRVLTGEYSSSSASHDHESDYTISAVSDLPRISHDLPRKTLVARNMG